MNKLKRVSDKEIVNAVIEAEVKLAIGLGYSDRMIMEKVANVTKSEIQRISREIGLRRKDYRDGDSPLGKFVWSTATTAIHAQRSPKSIKRATPKLLKEGWHI